MSQPVGQECREGVREPEPGPAICDADNVTKITAQLDAANESSGAKIKRNTPVSPNLRAHMERFIQIHQIDCLEKFVIVSPGHLNLINREFQYWFNHERPHSARGQLPPAYESPLAEWTSVKLKDVMCETRLGGALKAYWQRAA